MIPLIIGVLVALLGLAILADAWLPEEMPFRTERRRAEREERSLGGEAAIGIGVLCMAAALIGRDSWDYSIVAVIVGTVLFVMGAFMNRRFLRDRLVNRGSLRRAKPGEGPPPKGRTRIR